MQGRGQTEQVSVLPRIVAFRNTRKRVFVPVPKVIRGDRLRLIPICFVL
jgi:hypothetical protein